MIATMEKKVVRCAIYTRKSNEDGLEQAFNSLHAQRAMCESYIASFAQEGWTVLPTEYSDAGITGGTLDRPGLQKLLADIEAGRVDVVVNRFHRMPGQQTPRSPVVRDLDGIDRITFDSVGEAVIDSMAD